MYVVLNLKKNILYQHIFFIKLAKIGLSCLPIWCLDPSRWHRQFNATETISRREDARKLEIWRKEQKELELQEKKKQEELQ